MARSGTLSSPSLTVLLHSRSASAQTPPFLALAQWLRQKRLERGMGQAQLCARTLALGGLAGELKQPYLSRLERGERSLESLTPLRREALRQALELSVSEWVACTKLPVLSPLPPTDSLEQLELHRVPVYAQASADISFTEHSASIIDYALIPQLEHRPGMLVLEVQGQSMSTPGGGIRPGDRIYVDPGELDLHEGKVYVLHVVDVGLTIKRLRRYGEELWLTSDNPDHPPVHPDRATVVGRVYFHQPCGSRL